MKFGKYLASQKVLTWSFYYLDYDNLKKNIIRKASTTVEQQQREESFAGQLEKELQKINSFHSLKASELIHALKAIKKTIKDQAGKEELDEVESPIDWYETVSARLDTVTQELKKFDEYKTINVCAFYKLLKKHDKHQKNQLKGFWEIRLNKEPFVTTHAEIIDKVLIKLSKCWFMSHELHKQEKGLAQAEKKEVKTGQGQVFERSTTKYWVPIDKVLSVKCEVLKHLPVSSFNKKSSSLVTSVYYDNDELSLYHERLRREEGSQVIRMRTYNEAPHSTVFVERKVHHESWITEKSVKSRFPIKEKKLMQYLRGELKMETKLAKMKANNAISEKEYNETLTLANEIQESVLNRKLQPTMTSRYERTAFQLEGNATVRVSLDTRLDLITEHGYRNNKWGRDLTNEALIPDSEIHHFPHAVLEIKLSFQMGEEPPQWVKDLLAKDWIITCGKFSKYIHGCAVNLPRKVTLLPPWFPMLEATSEFRADDRVLFKGRDGSLFKRDGSMMASSKASGRFPAIGKNKSDIKIDVSKTPNAERKAERKKSEIELVTMSKDGKPIAKGQEAQKGKWATATGALATVPLVGRAFKKHDKKKKKKVQAPMKIEPKTFFANERTFLQWMSFLVLIQAIGITLMGLSTLLLVRVSGLIFVIIALIFMVYAIVIFLVRRLKISRREKGPYDERCGPVSIVVLLMIGLIIMLILNFGGYLLVCKGYALLDGNFYQYNPSDLVYDYDRKQLITVGPDMLTYIDVGSRKTYDYPVAGDLEGVTLVPGQDGKVYIGNEFPAYIIEWDFQSQTVLRQISLPLPNIVKDVGLEGLTFVPDSSNPHGGYFWVGNQNDGKIYIYDIDLSVESPTAVLIDSFSVLGGLPAISALNYHKDSGLVYGVVDRKWLFAMDPVDRSISGSWGIGLGNPEGVVVLGKGPTFEIFLACDACFEIWRFKFDWTEGVHSGKCAGGNTQVTVATTSTSGTVSSSSSSSTTATDPNA